MQLGLSVPSEVRPGFAQGGPASPFAPPTPPGPPPQQLNIGGIMSMKSLSATLAAEQAKAASEQLAASQNDPVVTGLAGEIRKHWMWAKEAKREVEQRMLDAVRARRGEYPPEKLAQIKKQGGSEIYMLLFATKARQAKALLSDTMIGAATEKPWTLSPTPKPDLPPETVSQIMQGVAQMVYGAEMSGQPMMVDEIRQLLEDARDRAVTQLTATAREEAERAEVQLEDILVEGGWLQALDEFLDDLTTFKTAFLKGPVVTRDPCLKWVPGADGKSKPEVYHENKKHWVRVDPFMMYPAAWSKNVNDAPLIERHRLNRGELSALRDVPGYNKQAIDAVLDAYGQGGLREWLAIDVEKPQAEGRDTLTNVVQNDLIDALQYWGSVSGKMLREWGMKPEEVPDEGAEYPVECWLIGHWVIKAVINPDPLGRRPYYADGYSRIPGAFWHNSLYDLVEDCQNMCNAAARALANNLGIASGPQVDVNVDRIAPGAEVTEVYPWKLWQTTSDPMGSTAKAVNFFQPQSYANELMQVYDKFSVMADEYSGIPRYMAGVEGTPGAGRTASGLSMMIGNASKSIKQLIASVDMRVIAPSVNDLYMQEIQTNAEMRGDLKIIARGAMSLTTREAAQVRRTEFLARTANPFDFQIMGPEGRSALLRETAKSLEMNTDDIVPAKSVLRQRQIAMAQSQQMQQQPDPSGETLMNGAPVTDNFSPTPA